MIPKLHHTLTFAAAALLLIGTTAQAQELTLTIDEYSAGNSVTGPTAVQNNFTGSGILGGTRRSGAIAEGLVTYANDQVTLFNENDDPEFGPSIQNFFFFYGSEAPLALDTTPYRAIVVEVVSFTDDFLGPFQPGVNAIVLTTDDDRATFLEGDLNVGLNYFVIADGINQNQFVADLSEVNRITVEYFLGFEQTAVIESVYFSTIPEPASMLLLMPGLALIAARKRNV